MNRAVLSLPALSLVLLAGCGLFAPPPPDTPAEAVFREQAGVLEAAVQTVESVRGRDGVAPALDKLRQCKETMAVLQARRLALDPNAGVLDYNADVRGVWASVLKRLTKANLDLQVRGGAGGYFSAASDVATAADEVSRVANPTSSGD